MKKCFLVGFLALFLLAGQAWAFDGYGPGHKHFDLQNQVFTLVHQNWVVQDLFIKMVSDQSDASNVEKYNHACDLYKKQSLDLGKRILAHIEDPNREVLLVISDMYKSLDPIARQALYPSLGYLRTEALQAFRSPISEAEFREYFPGYGYTEPGYKYRKGREVERETKGTTWQSEEHSITSTFNVSLTVSIDLLNILKGMVTSGAIKNLQVSNQYETNVNGTPMIVAQVSFQVIKSIITKTNRKFEVNKIWFELLRAKQSGYNTPGPWEVCGKTYEIINEPTGEEVVTGINQG